VLGNDSVVDNKSGGVISGGQGLVVRGEATTATLINAGTITSLTGQAARVIGEGAAILNNTGTISGNAGTALISQGSSTLTNSGTITGATGIGVFMNSQGPSTLTNSGAITGTVASVQFVGPGANGLTLQTGSTLNGQAMGSTAAGATNALILQGTGAANNNFTNFTSLDVQATGSWTLGGVASVGTAKITSGTLIVNGNLTATGNITNNGAVSVGAAGANLIAAGTFTQNAGSTLLNGGTLQASGGIFANAGLIGGTGTLIGPVTVTGGTVQVGASPDPLHIVGDFSQTGGVLNFEIDSDGLGGFLTSSLIFDQGAAIFINGATVNFNFVGGADPLAFYNKGLLDIDTFFQVSNGDTFSTDFSLAGLFVNDSFFVSPHAYDILGYDANDGHFIIDAGNGTDIPEPDTLALFLAGLFGFGALRHAAHRKPARA
jgi:hypothetical protein